MSGKIPNEATLTEQLKDEAIRLGFDRVGVAPAVTPPGLDHFLDWLVAGHQAGMTYLERAELRADPNKVMPGVRSVVMVALIYGQPDPSPLGPTSGRVARYARGLDYHELFWSRLGELLEWLQTQVPGIQGRAVCDSAPLMERDFAQLSGLGWIGKNTCLIDRKIGSFTLLGALLVDQVLEYDVPISTNHCGTCTRCLDACPTQAFEAPFVLNARKCLSYWTIEHRGIIPQEMAESFDEWVFGCDVCQDVCPWNRKAPPGRAHWLSAREGWTTPELLDWFEREGETFRQQIRRTALSRTKRHGLLRNAALILGNRRAKEAVDPLIRCLSEPDVGLRAAAVWALGRIGESRAIAHLEALLATETNPEVSELIREAIASLALLANSETN